MDRYVLVVAFDSDPKIDGSREFDAFRSAKQVYEKCKGISSSAATVRGSTFPDCSIIGSPAPQRWYFAIQAFCGLSQFCSLQWEELGCQKSDSEEAEPCAVEHCVSNLQMQDEQSESTYPQPAAELFEEAAEGLHQLSDKLPPPGKSLLDVLMLCMDMDAPNLKDLLPVIGSLKHMQAWHSAKVTIVTPHTIGWQAAASFLSARVCEPSGLQTCVDEGELWRGALLIRERKFVSELRFEGFCLRARGGACQDGLLDPGSHVNHARHAEVCHYYQPTLTLLQLVAVTDLPVILHSGTEFELELSSKSVKGKLLLDQLRSLQGKVGALFSLSCVISALAFPPSTQLSSSRWRELVAKRPKALPVPDVELKGERGQYLLLVQGSDSGACKARLIRTAGQINGAAALATVYDLMRERVLAVSDSTTADWLHSLPCLRGDQLLQRERRLAKAQALVLKECLRRREESRRPVALPANDLKVLLSLAREQYLKIHDARLPQAMCVSVDKENCVTPAQDIRHAAPFLWPERSVLQNYENLQKSRQRSRSSMFSTGSSDSLMGPKDSQRANAALLDARELLKHFTPEGLPSGELQPLLIHRGDWAFQLSPDLTPRKVKELPFRKAASSHYHGIEFCLDEDRALERDRGLVRLQSRLVRYETQTTCSKEPCPVPFALSPAPSPAVPSEQGSVPDGEALRAEAGRLKRRAREPDAREPDAREPDGRLSHKRLAKSESSESLSSQCSGGSARGTHPAARALRQQTARPQSSSSAPRRSSARSEPHRQPPPGQSQSESRSQKHNRMLREVVEKTLSNQGISSQHECFKACCDRLFDISKFYLKDLKTSRGLHEEMKKAASSNAKQVIEWVVEKASKK